MKKKEKPDTIHKIKTYFIILHDYENFKYIVTRSSNNDFVDIFHSQHIKNSFLECKNRVIASFF